MRGLPAARFPAYWHGRYGAAQTPAVVRHVDARRRASPTWLGVAPPGSGRLGPRSTPVDQGFSSSRSVSCCCLNARSQLWAAARPRPVTLGGLLVLALSFVAV